MKDAFVAFVRQGATVAARALLQLAAGALGVDAVTSSSIEQGLVAGAVALATLAWSIAEKRFVARTAAAAAKVAPVLLVAILLGACVPRIGADGQPVAFSAPTPASQLLIACQAYVGLERAVILRDIDGELTRDQVATYEAAMPVARRLCQPRPAGADIDLRAILAEVERINLQLTVMKGSSP